MDVKNTHSVTKTEISVFGRQALDTERRRYPSFAVKVLTVKNPAKTMLSKVDSPMSIGYLPILYLNLLYFLCCYIVALQNYYFAIDVWVFYTMFVEGICLDDSE